MPFIYKITNTHTQDIYIGKTERTVSERFNEHIRNAQSNMDTYLYRAMRKYDISNFVVEIIEEIAIDRLSEREMFYIHEMQPKYNMTSGGDGGSTTHNRMWVNNGVKNMYILKDDYIPEGYVRGRINCKFNNSDFQREMSRRGRAAQTPEIRKKAAAKATLTKRANGTFPDIAGDKNPSKREDVRKKISESKKRYHANNKDRKDK